MQDPPPSRFQFTLADIFVWTTYFAIGIALAKLSPGFIVVFTLLGIPAIFRNMATNRRSPQRMSLSERVVVWLGSLAMEALNFWVASCTAWAMVAVLLILLSQFRALWQPQTVNLLLVLVGSVVVIVFVITYETMRRSTWPK